MKVMYSFLSLMTVVAMVIMPFSYTTTPVYAQQAGPGNTVLICHYDEEGDSWKKIPVNENAVDAHFDEHGDFYFEGVESDGDEWCEDNAPEDDDTPPVCEVGEELVGNECVPVDEPEEQITVIAHKIICEDETLLPNWGDGSSNDAPHAINANTAQNFVDNNKGCEFAEGWDFQWAPQGTPIDPDGESNAGDLGSPWSTFGPTDVNGMTSEDILLSEAGASVWIHEVWNDDYIEFTGRTTSEDVSAEMYCHNDVLNYDNFEEVRNIQDGGTYYCVAFNVPVAPEEPEIPVCNPQENLIENGDFEAPVVTNSADWDVFEQGAAGLAWMLQWIQNPPQPDIPATLELQRGVNGWASADGEQHAELGTDWDGPNGPYQDESPAAVRISQEIDTVIGEEYVLSFAYSPRPETPKAQNTLNVLVEGGSVLLDEEHEEAGSSDVEWNLFTYVFKADSEQTTISFSDLGTNDTFGPFLDSVCLNGAVPTEPEPDPEPEYPELFCDADSMWAHEVVDYSPEKQKNGGDIAVDRTDSSNALGEAENNNTINFTALGFGGEITLKFEKPFKNGIGDDIQVFETTFGNETDETYPESAEVHASKDGIVWVALGSVGVNGGTLDLGSLDWAQYVKIVDTSDSTSEDFPANADGFDVDGVKALHCDNDDEQDGNLLPTVSISADPNEIEEGESSVLSWSASGGDGTLSCDIDHGVGTDVALVDSDSVSPATTTTYTITCEDEDGDIATDSVEVVVNEDGGGNNDGGDNEEEEEETSRVISTGGFAGGQGGSVAGASTGPGQVLGETCGIYLNNFLHIDSPNNNRMEVIKLQAFLKTFIQPSLEVTGVFDQATFDAVGAFQIAYAGHVIGPWAQQGLLGANESTGYVYITTRRYINILMCPFLQISIPETLSADNDITDNQ